MFISKRLTLPLLILIVTGAHLMGCTGSSASSSFGTQPGSSSIVTTAPDGASNGMTDTNFFYVAVDSTNNDIAHVHKSGEFGTNCSIAPTATLTDLKCIIDIPEGELHHKGLNLIYNVPPGMCRFLARRTYWYYNYPVGIGPKNITLFRHYDVQGKLLNDYTCTVDGVATAAGTCGPFLEASIDIIKGDSQCVYTTTDSSNQVHNGCFGSYNVTFTTKTDTSTGSTTDTRTEVRNWGGSGNGVIGGAGAISGWDKDTSGFPYQINTSVDKGVLNAHYNIPGGITTTRASTNLEIANYYKTASQTHTGYVAVGTTSTLPFYIDPIDDLSGDTIAKGNDSYEFECLDQGYERLHHISVYVREWDTYQDFANYIATKGVTEVPDRSGTEGGPNCTGLLDPTAPCNDFYSADNFATSVGNYIFTGAASRATFFPKLPGK